MARRTIPWADMTLFSGKRAFDYGTSEFEQPVNPVGSLYVRDIIKWMSDARLTQREKQIIVNYYCYGLSDLDIARHFINPKTGVPVAKQAVRQARMQALAKLRRVTADSGVFTVVAEAVGLSPAIEHENDKIEAAYIARQKRKNKQRN